MSFILYFIITIFIGYTGSSILGRYFNWPDSGVICAIAFIGSVILGRISNQKKALEIKKYSLKIDLVSDLGEPLIDRAFESKYEPESKIKLSSLKFRDDLEFVRWETINGVIECSNSLDAVLIMPNTNVSIKGIFKLKKKVN